MKRLPLRIRLTVWYSVILALTLCVFGLIAVLAMRKSIETTVDETLRDQVAGVSRLMEEVLPEGGERLDAELGEHVDLAIGSTDLVQISDENGNWVYRSPAMAHYNVPAQTQEARKYATLIVQGMPLRLLNTTIQIHGHSYRLQAGERMDDFYEATARFEWVLFVTTPLLLIFAAAGGYWMSRRALNPVDEIIRKAQGISEHSLSSRLAVPRTGDELQRLSETLNKMLERLETAFRRITRFTADASHELRTPVALMRTRAEIALRKPRDEGEYRETLAQNLRELERTSDLIEKLMLLARADSGTEAVQRTQMDLTALVRESYRQGQELGESKQLVFQQNLPNQALWIEGDAHSLRRLFLILIDNAVKYTPAQGQITVSLAGRDGFAFAEVADTGIGIAEEDLPHIFERFYRADKARSRESGGAGLGLSIALWIAQAHSGTLEAESKPEAGSVFRLRIPLARPRAQENL